MKRVCYLYHMNGTQTPNTMNNTTTPTFEELTRQRMEADFDNDWKRVMEIDDAIFKHYGIRHTPWGVR